MGLFQLLNGWAGQNAVLDAAARLFYIATVPVLGTILLALLLLVSRHPHAFSRWRTAGGVVLALVLCLLSQQVIEAGARGVGIDNLSPRPFMTRRVNILVVEPNDNSFPAPELMVAGALCAGIYALWPAVGYGAIVLTLLLGASRLFCGNNYAADVLVGTFLGWFWGVLGLAACHAPLWVPRKGAWKVGHQASWATMALGTAILATYIFLSTMPRFSAKLWTPWGLPATAATGPTGVGAAHSAMSEGEGVSNGVEAESAEELARAKRANLFLPEVEKYLRGNFPAQWDPKLGIHVT